MVVTLLIGLVFFFGGIAAVTNFRGTTDALTRRSRQRIEDNPLATQGANSSLRLWSYFVIPVGLILIVSSIARL